MDNSTSVHLLRDITKHQHAIDALALENLDFLAPVPAHDCAFWQQLEGCGTEPWLDTGDMEAAESLWCGSFGGLTTNNSLLNAEVQKGTYDELIHHAADLLAMVPRATQVSEIAFLLNVHHGLRLAQRFCAQVSIELHTSLANDLTTTLRYARRAHALCPEHFLVKLPLTPAGLIAARTLVAEEIPVNLTLGFSARQNHLAAAVARPDYVNVFLGRIDAYITDNGLGSGHMAGVKAARASQRALRTLPDCRSRQIGASLRCPEHLSALAGLDVLTLPPTLAVHAASKLDGAALRDHSDEDPPLELDGASDDDRLAVLWELSGQLQQACERLQARPPEHPDDLVAVLAGAGLADLFPDWSEDACEALNTQGKIPDHRHWRPAIAAGEVAVDALLSRAGLAAFARDQAALDTRVSEVLVG
ncbi:MAG: transaldolase family protein [Planctomycetota bacterium]